MKKRSPAKNNYNNVIPNEISVISSRQIEDLITAIEHDLGITIGWLRGSDLNVNKIQTEICLFHKHDTHQIRVHLNNCLITSQIKMNILGVLFD